MGAVTTPRTVSEARYAYWRTIVDLAKESGIPKVEWCRSNCISIKTFNHYEGIFERQERRTSYYKGSHSQIGIGRDEVSVEETNEESTVATDDNQGQEEDQEVLAEEAVHDSVHDNVPEQGKRIGTDPERYFEIPFSEDHYYIGEDSNGIRKAWRFEENGAGSGNDTEAETETHPVTDTDPGNGNKSAGMGSGVMSHSSGTETSEGLTIEADGFKLTIGANVSEESLRNILKVVKGNA